MSPDPSIRLQMEVVETELMLADLQSLERRKEPLVKKARGGDKEAKAMLDLVEREPPCWKTENPRGPWISARTKRHTLGRCNY